MPPYVTRQPLSAGPGPVRDPTVVVDGLRLAASTVTSCPPDAEVFVCDAVAGEPCGYLWIEPEGTPHITRWQPLDARPRENRGADEEES